MQQRCILLCIKLKKHLAKSPNRGSRRGRALHLHPCTCVESCVYVCGGVPDTLACPIIGFPLWQHGAHMRGPSVSFLLHKCGNVFAHAHLAGGGGGLTASCRTGYRGKHTHTYTQAAPDPHILIVIFTVEMQLHMSTHTSSTGQNVRLMCMWGFITVPAHRIQQVTLKVMKETHTFAFTPHTAVHKVIWASYGGEN